LRHEWVSCLLFSAFLTDYESDESWLQAIIEGKLDDSNLEIKDNRHLESKKKDADKGLNLEKKDAADILTWLILTHHRLPYIKDLENQSYSFNSISDFFQNVTKEWGYAGGEVSRTDECLKLKGYLKDSDRWMKELKKWSKKLKDNLPLLKKSLEDGSYRLLLLYSRTAMMLGDHLYSSQQADSSWCDGILYANTETSDKNPRKSKLKQKLDEHLVGVSQKALEIAHMLPKFESDFEYCSDLDELNKKSKDEKFKWQDKAVSAITPFAKEKQGFFIVNMASTGCGKTLANAKIMNALSNNKLRYTLALGLRSLTLQTGDEYREKIKLDRTELAVIIGSKSHLELYQHNNQIEMDQDKFHIGSESLEELSEDYFIDGDVIKYAEPHFKTVIKNKKHEQFLYTPIVVCTIDHIIAASEVTRGGKYILPTIRLMSSDLVIDEIDDFDQESDLVAIGRLIHLAGMLGRRVMISSATIPPSMAEGYFNAYQEGWKIYSRTMNLKEGVHCAWVDEFNSSVQIVKEDSYKTHHEKFIRNRVAKLMDPKTCIIKRKGKIVEVEIEDEIDRKKYFETIKQTIVEQHNRNSNLDQDSGKQISFGMVRTANVEPCIELAKYLIEADFSGNIDLKVMVYHGKQVLLLRSHQERHLDAVLKRHKPGIEEDGVFREEFRIIRKHINDCNKNNIIFLLVTTPIEEVGRDHDFDFAVLEPSSMRSIIQLAGRVMRHREVEAKEPNISIMQYNLKGKRKIAYSKPGYENLNNSLETHNIKELLQGSDIENHIDSIPRIQNPNEKFKPTQNLISLEHKVIKDCLTDYEATAAKTMQGWLKTCVWMSAASQKLASFRTGDKPLRYYLMPKEDYQENFIFTQKNDSGQHSEQKNKIAFSEDEIQSTKLWLQRDYGEILSTIAEQKELTQKEAAEKFGLLEVVEYKDESNQYEYSEQFGLIKIKQG
jgi:CRISPR-associated endonuclease/helicase Cas3